MIFILCSLIVVFVRAQGNSLLWKLSGKELQQPSYLFGTIHLICEENYFWTDSMRSAFTSCQQLYLELPMADSNFQLKWIQYMMLPKGVQLKDFFAPEAYDKINKYFTDSLKIPLAALSKMKPFGLFSLILVKQAGCNKGMPISYEEKLVNYAAENGLPVKGLETIAAQIKIFDDMPRDSMAKLILSSIADLDKNKIQFQQMTKAYLVQDLLGMHNSFTQSPEYVTMQEELLFKRNRNWIPLIIEAAKTKATFFAVGAAHLGGDKGIIELLRKNGYSVEPVK